MPRKLEGYENYRVVVYPASATWMFTNGKDDDQITCERIERDIRKHVDDVRHVVIERDSVYACDFCGSTWTEDSPDFNGGCCDADVGAHEAQS